MSHGLQPLVDGVEGDLPDITGGASPLRTVRDCTTENAQAPFTASGYYLQSPLHGNDA